MNFKNGKKHSSHGTGRFTLKDFKFLGEDVILEEGVLVFHPESIILGQNVYIGHGTILKGYYKNEMLIGDDTWIGQNCFLHSAGGIKIGRAVGIGPGVKILTSIHEEGSLSRPVLHNPIKFGRVIVGDGADIGIGAIILPDVTIGEGAVVGAGAVVTKDVSAYTVVAGNPARRLRSRSESKK